MQDSDSVDDELETIECRAGKPYIEPSINNNFFAINIFKLRIIASDLIIAVTYCGFITTIVLPYTDTTLTSTQLSSPCVRCGAVCPYCI